jgi:hypothetical protein
MVLNMHPDIFVFDRIEAGYSMYLETRCEVVVSERLRNGKWAEDGYTL